MTKTWSFYEAATGVFRAKRLTCPPSFDVQVPEGCIVIEGIFDHERQRVDLATGEIIDDQSLGAQRDQERRRSATLQQIAEAEQRQQRPMRELVRDPANVEARRRLDEIEAEIAKLRTSLET